MSDLYRVLGVGRDATSKEIHRAYRRKAKLSHPDSGGSVEAFGELGTAYAVLSNAERRELYDRTGEIRPPKPDTLDASAIEIIAQKLGLIIHAERDVTSMDVAALLEQTIREDIAERKEQWFSNFAVSGHRRDALRQLVADLRARDLGVVLLAPPLYPDLLNGVAGEVRMFRSAMNELAAEQAA